MQKIQANSLILSPIKISEPDSDNPFINSEFEMPADLVIYTAGMTQSKLIADIPVEKDPFGRILVSRTLQVKNRPDIFALGDCACVSG